MPVAIQPTHNSPTWTRLPRTLTSLEWAPRREVPSWGPRAVVRVGVEAAEAHPSKTGS
ncbi:hypothetical protein BHM03_00062268, partial [Ensete ventricosum]